MFVLANIVDALCVVSHALITAYIFVVLAACVITFLPVPRYHPAVRLLRQLTEPCFDFVRRKMPFTRGRGPLDFSPLVVVIALELADLIVVRSLQQIAHGL